MKKISSVIRQTHGYLGFPLIGVNGYAGEQDGSYVILTDIMTFRSKADADRKFPDGIGDDVDLHWATYRPGRGWQVVLGWWVDREE